VRKAATLAALLAALILLICALEYLRKGVVVFPTTSNMRNLLQWVGLFGILSLGQAFVIVTGGIDLAVGSVVCLTGISAAMLFPKFGAMGVPTGATALFVLAIAATIGLWHGVLVAKVRMQPFVVTLCGLFFYRGIARYVAEDRTQGFRNEYTAWRWLGNGYIPDQNSSLIPVAFVIFIVLAVLVGAFLHLTAPGRHLFALGANEEAARFSGVNTARLKIFAYTMCGLFAGIGGLLFAFKVNSVGPSEFGSFFELYAIAGVVLGGCSLRGGSGNIAGVVIGVAIMRILENMVNLLDIPSELTYIVIGGAILVGVLVDEMLSRRPGYARHQPAVSE
jgi:ribose transport system permease protein